MSAALLYVPQLAERLGMTETAVRCAVQRRSAAIPAPVRLGRRIAWRERDVERWLEGLKPMGYPVSSSRRSRCSGVT